MLLQRSRFLLVNNAASALLVCAAMTTAAHAAGDASPGQTVTGQPAAATVDATDQLRFQPMTVQVSGGRVVEWTNAGAIPHNVTFDRYPALTSGTMNRGDRHEIRFTSPGTYRYRCTFHPGMDGAVTVT